MDFAHFAALLQARSSAVSRRGVLSGATGGLLATWPLGLGLDEAEAKKNRKRKKRGKKKRKQEQPPASPPSSPVVRADAACPGPSDNGFDASGRARLAQTFTALASGPLASAKLDIQQSIGTGGDYILRLSPVDGGGVPSNDVLATAFVPNGSGPEEMSPVTFTFLDPFSVVAGAKYALVLLQPGGDNFSWGSRSGDVCLGQAFASESQSAPFEVFGNGNDFVFTTFVNA